MRPSRPISFAILIASLCLSLTNCKQENGSKAVVVSDPRGAVVSEDAVSRAELTAVLASRDFDQSIVLINRVKRMRYQGEVLPLLMQVWQLDLSAIPQVDKAFAAHPRIRLEVADVLIQASRNGKVGLQTDAYSGYARQHVSSKDRDVARQAILVLGVANDAADVELLINVLAEENGATFGAAANSFVRNCAVDDARVAQIASHIKNQERGEYLRSSWKDMQALRSHICRR